MGILLSCCFGPRQKDPTIDQTSQFQQQPDIERDLGPARAGIDHKEHGEEPIQPQRPKQVVSPRTENLPVHHDEDFGPQNHVQLTRTTQSNDFTNEVSLEYAARNGLSQHSAAYSLGPLPLDPREPSPFLIWMENRYGSDYERSLRPILPFKYPIGSRSSGPGPAESHQLSITDLSDENDEYSDDQNQGGDSGEVDYSGQGWGSGSGWETVQRHRHPTRLSDVLEEDERSKASIAEPVNEWISVKANPKPKPDVVRPIAVRQE